MARALAKYPISELCHGGATGWDAHAAAWGVRYLGVSNVHKFPAEWEAFCPQCPEHRRRRKDGSEYCPAQGGIRNQRMLEQFKPDAVIAGPGSSGTADMRWRAAAAGVRIYSE